MTATMLMKQQPRKLMFHLVLFMFLGWLVLLLWNLGLWITKHRFTPTLNLEVHELAQLVTLSTKIMWMKFLTLITSLPLFILTLLAGLVDGLSQRAIRTACLGRESSYLFHQLTRYAKRGVVLFLGLWFLIPLSINPAWVFIPMAVFVGLMTAMTANRFKKYW